MDIKIKALCGELKDDYFYFFDNIAFSDHEEWSWCYCAYDHMNKETENSLDGKGKEGIRNYAGDLIDKGVLRGYLLYIDGMPEGWCNVGEKSSYLRLNENKAIQFDDFKKIKAITCFIIGSSHRRKGLATKLLAKVCEDARDEGYDCVEAYPKKSGDIYANYPGYVAMYEKNGFSAYSETEKSYVMRLTLNKAEIG